MKTEHLRREWVVLRTELFRYSVVAQFRSKGEAMRFARDEARRWPLDPVVVFKAVGGYDNEGRTRLSFKPSR